MTADESRLREELLHRRIVDEGILLDLEKDVGYRLNDAGTSIVALLAEGVTGERLIERLCEEYDIDRGSCRLEVERFLEELRSKGLLEAG